jgi:hypothetical protein
MSFIRSALDPSDILGELLFGLIMVLTFTLGAAVAGGYETGLLLAATGCNVAWGVIDAVLVTMSGRYVRRRRGMLVRALREAPDEASALAAIREQFGTAWRPRSVPRTATRSTAASTGCSRARSRCRCT